VLLEVGACGESLAAVFAEERTIARVKPLVPDQVTYLQRHRFSSRLTLMGGGKALTCEKDFLQSSNLH
jgi:hypothetical protein